MHRWCSSSHPVFQVQWQCSKRSQNNRNNFYLDIPQFFISRARSWYFSTFSRSFNWVCESSGIATSIILQSLLFLSINTIFDLRDYITWSIWIGKSRYFLKFLFSITDSEECFYHFPAWRKPACLHWFERTQTYLIRKNDMNTLQNQLLKTSLLLLLLLLLLLSVV